MALRVRHTTRYATLGHLLLKHRAAALEGPATESGSALDEGIEADPAEKAGEAATAADAAALVAELVGMGPAVADG